MKGVDNLDVIVLANAIGIIVSVWVIALNKLGENIVLALMITWVTLIMTQLVIIDSKGYL